MVLGAGLGSRLKPFTEKFPKPLIPVLGVPCIDYSLLSLKDAGITDVMVNVHAHADQMRAYLTTSISDETAKLLGSAGGFRKALPFFHGQPFISMNADVLSCIDLAALTRRHEELQKSKDVWMTLVIARGKTLIAQQGSYTEILTDEKTGLITGFGPKKNQVPFYTGTAVFDPRCFEHLPEGVPSEFVPEVLKPLIEQGKVGFMYSEEIWMDVGSAELWHQSHFDLWHAYQQNQIPQSWRKAIEQGMKTLVFSDTDRVVDYDLPPQVCDHDYIKREGIHYAVPRLGN